MRDLDEALVAGIKRAMAESRVSMTALASATKIPYRSLQNYLSGRSKMPASVYVTICNALGIDNQYVSQGTFHLQLAPLYDAFWRVFGDGLLELRSLPDTGGLEDMARHNRKQEAAHEFAVKISTAYNEEILDRLKNSPIKQARPLVEGAKSGSQ